MNKTEMAQLKNTVEEIRTSGEKVSDRIHKLQMLISGNPGIPEETAAFILEIIEKLQGLPETEKIAHYYSWR